MSERSVTERSVTHATFVLERVYPAAPAKVWAAWSRKENKARWFLGPEGWESSGFELDFRVGGVERLSSRFAGGPAHRYEAHYLDIVPGERIITAFDMHLDDRRISVSLATIEFRPEGAGTRLRFTEQGAFLDGYDDPAARERGTREMLDQLGAALALQTD